MSIINYSGLSVEIIKKPIKHCYLRLKSDGTLILTANRFISQAQIEAILTNNIAKFRQQALLLKQKHVKQNQICHLWYLGNQYPITITAAEINLANWSDSGVLVKQVDINNINLTQELILRWQLEQAQQMFQERFNLGLQVIADWNVTLPTLSIRHMRSRFGSYSKATNNICLNAYLIRVPIKFVDYVIAHELSHIRHFNHGKLFYQQLEELFPEWHTTQNELRQFAKSYLFD